VHRLAVVVVSAALLLAGGCGVGAGARPSAETPEPAPSRSTPASPSSSPSSSPRATRVPSKHLPRPPRASDRPVVGVAPPPWLGTRVLPKRPDGFGEIRPTPPELVRRRFTLPDRLPELPGTGFAARVSTPAPADVVARSTWTRGCPVAASDLSWVRLTFRGFDQQRHTGEILVNRAVADDVVAVFRRLYAARFPLEEMRINTAAEQTAPPTGDGNDTASFNCRATRGATTYSQHAYGLAIDVHPFPNPYHQGDVVLPELASSYLDRGWVRPGMITPDGPVVRAFSSIGWTWGGTWHSLKDLQHFSRSGQ
jgi:hypothetical protein